jgi:hypothetical protein
MITATRGRARPRPRGHGYHQAVSTGDGLAVRFPGRPPGGAG